MTDIDLASRMHAACTRLTHCQEAEDDIVERHVAIPEIVGIVIRHIIVVSLATRRIRSEESFTVHTGALALAARAN